MNGTEIIKAKRNVDHRGWLQELGRGDFKQVNWSSSRAGVLRGLHYAPYSKLVTCTRGRIFDVSVDCRLDMPSLGTVKWTVLELGNVAQAFIPPYFAHGFLALTDCDVVYLQSDEWHDNELTIHFQDQDLSIGWPVLREPLTLSKKDHEGLPWKEFLRLLVDLRLMQSAN